MARKNTINIIEHFKSVYKYFKWMNPLFNKTSTIDDFLDQAATLT